MDKKQFNRLPIGTAFKYSWSEKWEDTGEIIVKTAKTKILTVQSFCKGKEDSTGEEINVNIHYQFLFKVPIWVQKMYNPNFINGKR